MNPRPRRFRRWLWYTATALVVFGGVVAVLNYSSLARINGIDVQGTRSVDVEAVREAVTLGYEKTIFGHTYRIPSLFNFDSAKGRSRLLAVFPQISDAVVTRQWPHRVSVAITERTPLGIWCRRGDGTAGDFTCRFWDDHGVRWGTAALSTGPLLLQVRDERSDDVVDDTLLHGILAAMDGLRDLGLKAKMVTLPDAEPGGMRIALDKRYELYLDALADMTGQMDTLGVFLAERAKDPAFQPAYIDLRTPGRIYYK